MAASTSSHAMPALPDGYGPGHLLLALLAADLVGQVAIVAASRHDRQ